MSELYREERKAQELKGKYLVHFVETICLQTMWVVKTLITKMEPENLNSPTQHMCVYLNVNPLK